MKWFLERIMGRAVCFAGGGGGAERIITDDMKASAEVAAEQWNRYQDFYVPFEKKFMDDVTRDPAQTEATLKGQVNADMMQAASKVAPVDPVRGMPALSPSAMTKGLSKGFGTARTAAVNQQQTGLNTAIAMGRGQAVQAMTTQQQLAEQSGQTALQESINSAQNDMANRGAMFKGIGMAAGLAGSATSSALAAPVAAPGAGVGGTHGFFGSPSIGVTYQNPYYSG